MSAWRPVRWTRRLQHWRRRHPGAAKRAIRVLVALELSTLLVNSLGAEAFDPPAPEAEGIPVHTPYGHDTRLAVRQNPAQAPACENVPGWARSALITFTLTEGCDGPGLNPRSTYAFDGLLLVLNEGRSPARIQAVATTTSGGSSEITVALGHSGSSPYGIRSSWMNLEPGEHTLLGVRLRTGSLEAGETVEGRIELHADPGK